jgi:hypothetical protein
MDEIQREITGEPALHVRDEHLFESGIGWPRRTDHLLQGVLAWKQIHVIVLAPAIRRRLHHRHACQKSSGATCAGGHHTGRAGHLHSHRDERAGQLVAGYASWNLNGSFSKDAAAVAAHGQSERAKAMFVGTPRRFELTIRLTKKAPGLRRGLWFCSRISAYRLTVMLV